MGMATLQPILKMTSHSEEADAYLFSKLIHELGIDDSLYFMLNVNGKSYNVFRIWYYFDVIKI